MDSKKLKILIADDEEGLRLSMAGILELEEYYVVTAEDGYEAIEKAKLESFDIAFLDIKMPGINGVETFKEIKKISPETVVIMMTAYAVKDLIKEAISEGAYTCLNKPFDMDKIIDTIKELSLKPFVVVIDDDPNLCDLLYDRLKENGFKVVTRSSGMDGIELVKRKTPDMIFLDIVMDGMDGIDTYKNLKELMGQNCPKTVIMSAQDLRSKFEEARQMGALECLKKPLDMKHLKELIYENMDKDKKVKICIVDDDKEMCDTLKKTLTTNGYDVEVAYSGSEVIEKIKNEVFKVIILDIKLPDINGVEVYEKIKAINPNMGVIFISGNAAEGPIEDTIRKNNYIYLQKPFEPDYIIRMLENIRKRKERLL